MFQNNLNSLLLASNYLEIVYLMISLLLFFPFLLIIQDTFFRVLFMIVAWVPRFKSVASQSDHIPNLKILYLFVANNEQRVIRESVERVRQVAGLTPDDSIVVLADHCTDQTVDIANDCGAKVYQRTEGKPGKSEALSWFASKISKQIEVDIVVVLDADTLVGENFSAKLKSAFEREVDVIQVFVHPITSSNSPLSLLASYSELLSQKVDDEARSRLGWSVPLRGTGMAFRKKIFEDVCRRIKTQVDDIELSLLLMERKIPVHYCSQIEILDPKANNMLGLAKQRGRWLKGQRHIWNTKRQDFWLFLGLGLPALSLMQSLIIKPKTALVVIKIMVLGVLMLWLHENLIHQVMLYVTLGGILIDFFYYSIGLKYTSDAGMYFFAMFSAPIFVVLWIISWGFSILPGQGWLRARDE